MRGIVSLPPEGYLFPVLGIEAGPSDSTSRIRREKRCQPALVPAEAHGIRNVSVAHPIRERRLALPRWKPQEPVIGGGFIGSEIAAALRAEQPCRPA
jgi:hypothetical protein